MGQALGSVPPKPPGQAHSDLHDLPLPTVSEHTGPQSDVHIDARMLHGRINGECMLIDQPRLRKTLDSLIGGGRRRGSRGRQNTNTWGGHQHGNVTSLEELAMRIDASSARRAERAAQRIAIEYPEDLPIAARRDEIIQAIRDHQVIVLCGETGSGKTTQLPKFCLEAGLGVAGMIGHTQPRRLAARSVSKRIASELHTTVGDLVGFKIRFADQTGDACRIKIMTDGMLLTEMTHDRNLLQYDALIIDEAHERSLNIDFLVGYLKQLLPKRPDLKIIITSATIDPQRFSEHFQDAPIIEVLGRAYPVEVRYRPLVSDEEDAQDRDMPQGVLEALQELQNERFDPRASDTLVFLPGERETRMVHKALRGLEQQGVEVLPLYARLSNEAQDRVFAHHHGRRIVLATNVAETSLTVPRIGSVIDTGVARISRYSARRNVQMLPIEAISQASAN